MKVYVLESEAEWTRDLTEMGVQKAYNLEGVFSSLEKACEANEILDIAGFITEVDLDRVAIEHQHGDVGTNQTEARDLR